MATYKHGVYTSEQATSMTAPVTGTAGLQVVVGTAPVNMLEHPEQAVNTPLLAYNYKEAVAAVGYHDDFAAYTLCESISAAFSVVGTGPLVLINVLDPAKHTADIAETTVQVNSGVAVLDVVGVLLDKLTVKSGSTAMTRDTDYTASFNNDGTLNIVPLAGGKAASATSNNYIPEKINDANAYLDGTRMIGVAASVDLPEINMKTGTVEGFGIGGEVDSPTIGQWESFEQAVQFNTLYSSAVDRRKRS